MYFSLNWIHCISWFLNKTIALSELVTEDLRFYALNDYDRNKKVTPLME